VSEWTPEQRLPVQVGDAFASLFDWVVERRFNHTADDRRWQDNVVSDPATAALVAAVEAGDTDTPALLQQVLDEASAKERPDDHGLGYAAYTCLYAIDRGFARHHPTRGGRSSRMREHYYEHGRYDTGLRRGYVVPKWTTRPGGTVFDEHFTWLVRADVDRRDIVVLGSRARSRPRGLDNPRIVVAPVLYEFFEGGATPLDAYFRHAQVGSDKCFRVQHNMASGHLQERVRRVVRAIRDDGATIAILPELVLNSALLKLLRTELKTTHFEFAARGEVPSLQWVVAGAAMPRPAGSKWPTSNRAYVLSSAGNIISASPPDGNEGQMHWVQGKRHRYVLSEQAQQNYGITGRFRVTCDRIEAISTGTEQFVFEDPSGRYAILICEDVAHEEQTLESLRRMRCSVVIIILMDGPLRERWATEAAADLTTRLGAFTLVANSLLLPNLPKQREYHSAKRKEPDHYPHGKEWVGVLITPGGEDAMEWAAAPMSPLATEASTLLSSPLELPVRSVDAIEV
jgi:predicted amidohydrolase